MASGLEGVCVADSRISLVDGQAGRLILRGVHLHDLGDKSFEELARFLWEVPLENLGEARLRVAPALRELLPLAHGLAPIEWLRLALDRLPDTKNPADWVAALGVALALRRHPAAEPDPQADHVSDVARMAGLKWPDGLRRYWICVAEHGMNASTFTARVVASTRAGQRAALSAALGALQGPLHGGAPGPVLDMLDELQQAPDPEDWFRHKLARGERLMGFGHRIYRVRDPRAEVLRVACQKLAEQSSELAERLRFAERMEKLATAVLAAHKPGRVLQTNVEYYTALLLEAIGFEREEFTAVFACGRVLGWLAHIFEQEKEGRLIRPEVRYVGPLPDER
ncbi:MAG: citrate synthase [Candidatus Eremiobacteraeota bacterium]|nr:citrate synthase [Candidatus Eremiobacteraeota bacterium]MCW5867891.1 citrate synthase [Candidatus Eremiobacteraeota bacterium]